MPRELRGKLPWVVVADALPGCQEFRFRIVGSRVADYFFGDGTGTTVREAFAVAAKGLADGLLQLYRSVCVQRVPMRLTSPCSRWRGTYFPPLDSIYMPYSSEKETADRIIYAFSFNY